MKPNKFIYAFASLGLGITTTGAWAMASDPLEDNDGSLSSEKPHIPEPMVFDLVRPLGVEKGEVEINILSQYSGRGEVEWAPEIEFAPRDNLAFELELPIENTTVSQYKVGIQGTFGVHQKQFIHGWQAIGRYDIHGKSFSGDLMYLAGYSPKSRWSLFNMAGIRLGAENKTTKPSGLLNTSAFYMMSERITFGLEMNNEFNNHKRWGYLLTPQLHIDLDRNFSLQMGVGYSSLMHKSREWQGISRIIFAF